MLFNVIVERSESDAEQRINNMVENVAHLNVLITPTLMDLSLSDAL